MLEHLKLLQVRAHFTAQEAGQLPPYLGSTLRGILGHCLRDFVCIHPMLRCHLCELSTSCAYALSFNSPGNEAGAVNPFVIHVPVRDKEKWQPGDRLTFDITIIGRAADMSGFYLDGLLAMSQRGWGANRMRFALTQITDPLTNSLIWSGGRTWLRNLQPTPILSAERSASSALIQFDTPLRLLIKRSLCRQPTFRDLIHSISRRVGLLSHAYTGQRIQWDETALLDRAEGIQTVEENWRFVDFERYSMTYDRKLSLPAIEGWARYEGDLTLFIPWLEAGKRLHVGKNATHGFGHYQVFYG
ncbi:CRISPR system precrRNA processing endoribonuclease RAMP protein Cas6 [Paenibacillus monticola]|uniref:CRISPR system precrRNA processing endoribonuclease RAMP protein Cas6 n=1 Tax=Paenibacillus monticola TaxID=2666075 RepID=A0A7X2H425_9BACL|nr:CRISPR system precrRNA processing endoribonuclease RAMP protein Cas6 [Paenibacillus monticola]MRN53126.1 CRISPR system precrRNA processing endoribonuclease RAMP protein Cas6 [Paenibacillus monticola]